MQVLLHQLVGGERPTFNAVLHHILVRPARLELLLREQSGELLDVGLAN